MDGMCEQVADIPGINSNNCRFSWVAGLREKKMMSVELSEAGLNIAHATVEDWFDAFMQSAPFDRLNAAQQRRAGAITRYFTEYSYHHLGIAPGGWDSEMVRECCTEILPRKVSAELSFFETLTPVLSAFFRFLGEQRLHPAGHALADSVEDIADEVVSAARDRSRWGPAKRFAMAAHESGVDINDPASMDAFLHRANEVRAAQCGFAGNSHSGADVSAGPYEPCPCGSGKKFRFCCQRRS
jgi:hypothetical protein